jgi:hypothetical protein
MGLNTDCLQNVLAADGTTIVDARDIHRVDRPEVISMAVAASHFSPNDQRVDRLFGVDQCLLVHHVLS